MILVQNMAPVKKKNARYKNNFKEIKSLTISDVLCPICRSIIIEPVSLPCHHLFCFKCFNGTIENNSLSCPICRLRIGSWLRSASKNNKIVNYELWEYIQESFKAEVEAKLNGKELTTSHTNEPVALRLANPGEIQKEYQKQLSVQQEIYRKEREKEERLSQELLKKLQEQEELKRLQNEKIIKEDEEIAKRLANSLSTDNSPNKSVFNTQLMNSEQEIIKNYLTKQSLPTDIIYNYDYNIKKAANNNFGKYSSTQENDINVQSNEHNKHPQLASKYDCLIKSFSMKLSHGKDVVKQGIFGSSNLSTNKSLSIFAKGSSRSQQLQAMSLLRELGKTYDDNDELAKKYDSITQELCHFKPIKTAIITKRRLINGKPVANPLPISPPKRPIPRTRVHNENEISTFTLKGRKMLKYSGLSSAFAAHPTILFCENLIITESEDETTDSFNFMKSRKRLCDETDQNKNLHISSKQFKIMSTDKTKLLEQSDVNFTNTCKRTYSNVRVRFDCKPSPKKSKASVKELFGTKSTKQLKHTKFSDDFQPLDLYKTKGNLVENGNDNGFKDKMLQEQKDLEFAKKLQDYLNKCDSDDKPYTLRKSNTKNNYLVSDYTKRGTRTSPRKRQTTLDSIFLSSHK